MLQLNTLIEQNSPQMIEQQLIKQYLTFAKHNGVSQHVAHQSLIWVLKLMRFHNGAHPSDLNQHDVETYLSALAIEQYVSNSTQQLALSAIHSFYREFVKTDLQLKQFVKSKTRRGFSDRFSASVCQTIIQNLSGPSQLMTKLAYHCQLRFSQVAKLKVSDIDLKSGTLSVFDKNNSIKFKAVIPLSLQLDLRIQKMRANQLNKQLKRQLDKHAFTPASGNKPTQIGLFKEHTSLLFILSDIKELSSLKIQQQISPESQLAILKSEIKLILNRTNLFSMLNKPSNSNNTTVATLKKKSKNLKAATKSVAKPSLFALTKTTSSTNKPLTTRAIDSYFNQIESRSNLQEDFFDLGAA